MTRDFEAQLHAIESARADVLLIDIANNGGGTEWAEAVARIVTAVRLKSERIGFVRGPHWAKQFADTVANLRVDAKGASRKDAEMRPSLWVRRRWAQVAAIPMAALPQRSKAAAVFWRCRIATGGGCTRNWNRN